MTDWAHTRTRIVLAVAPLAGLLAGFLTVSAGGASVQDQVEFFGLFMLPSLFVLGALLASFDRRWGWTAGVPLMLTQPIGWLFADWTGWTYILCGVFAALAIAMTVVLRGVRALVDGLFGPADASRPPGDGKTWIVLGGAAAVGVVAGFITAAVSPIRGPDAMAAALVPWLLPVGLALTLVDRRWGWLSALPLTLGQVLGFVMTTNPARPYSILPFYCGPGLLLFGIMGVALAGLLRLLRLVFDTLAGRTAKPRPGCCRECGYNLTGNVSGVCPECGRAVTSIRSA